MSIGKTIRELRIENKMTQSSLAEVLHLSQDTVSLWELDKSLPDVNSVIVLAKLFGVSTDYLLGLEK